jgi:cytoskeletal protein CcmA (bactofilin family)
MGRASGSKTEPTGNQERTSNQYNYAAQPKETFPAAQSRAMSESETMARDIKEGRLSGFVGSGTVLTGETTFQAMLRIDGHLTGRVMSETGTLIVGSTGRVDANIAVAAAMINGTVNGDIVVSERLELGRTARITGNIQAPRLLMEDGAVLEGNCSMINARENLEKRTAEANAPIVTNDISTVDETAESNYLGAIDEETGEAVVS